MKWNVVIIITIINITLISGWKRHNVTIVQENQVLAVGTAVHEVCNVSYCTYPDECDYQCDCGRGHECKRCHESSCHICCCRVCYGNSDCRCQLEDTNIQFVTAAKVALGSALIITMIAIMAILWRTCFKRRINRGSGGETTERDDVSLNSIQRYVITRLRDRPPRYDNTLGKPPAYFECMRSPSSDTISEPPPYSSVVVPEESLLPEYNLEPLPPPSISPNDPILQPLPLNVFALSAVSGRTEQQEEFIESPILDMDAFVSVQSSSQNNLTICDIEALSLSESPDSSLEPEASGFVNLGYNSDENINFEEVNEQRHHQNTTVKFVHLSESSESDSL